MKKMMTILWNLWTSTEIKVGVLFSFLWLVLEHIVGGFDEQITALVILTSLDILTGFIGAFKTHSFMSSVATRGLFKKAAMILVVGLGVLLDAAMHTHTIRTMFIGGFAIIEALSIVENIDKMGYGQYIPEFLRKCLAQIATEKKVKRKDDKESY